MDNTELLTLAVALAMDAFAVAIATGAATRQVTARQTFRLAWHFGLFQALMPVAGWLLGGAVRHHIEAYDHWIAFALLGYIGAKMIREAFGEEDAARGDPTRGATLVMLSIATSVDALAVGLSLSVLGVSVWTPALVIGLTAMLFTAGGLHLGKTAVKAKRLGTYAEVLGGAVLILIGLRILWEHGALPA
ncbi:Putative Mn2+ efflux pump MntP [Humidesulfovibrio mexicanus]|uniref:Putative manganese efflux pump MntP n=1 Tax=Humidesulfovibrio mexicanus TaxID=147047 RepID=A0A239A9L7_9BACT|nr:manganese efflux pump MntP family protein [Humidesulfovibrio mexicanus]SNR91778.1 Putative Mn2+ efflux pump MntP [Humidesulfovibrio mexicanus]